MTSLDRKIHWTRVHMPLTSSMIDALPRLEGIRLACSMHLEVKMVPTLEGLLRRGAKLFLTTCNPQTVDDRVVDWLASRGAQAQAWRGMSEEDRDVAIRKAFEWAPTHLCEMGADITAALLGGSGNPLSIQAGLEATGSGTSRLEGLKVPYPIFNWDDVPLKEGLHNRYMVGLVACHAFFERTHLTFHGKRVVIVGFGLVGRGACEAARAYGGTVAVVEKDATRAVEAQFAGWPVVSLEQGLRQADIVITATGARHVIGEKHLSLLRDGVFLVNVGHTAEEIDVPALRACPHEEVLPLVEEFRVGNRSIYLFAMGSMANLTAGHGDSVNAFDITAAVLVAGIGFLVTRAAAFSPGLHLLPREAWEPVATARAARG
ncbi:MAG: adenosylhomocysteinase [Deltaproteobacteria bacterium]|nr:adenosylhomocysteinase [Deltaproteobacteria bacterium]